MRNVVNEESPVLDLILPLAVPAASSAEGNGIDQLDLIKKV